MHFLIILFFHILSAEVADSTKKEVESIFSQGQEFVGKFPSGHLEEVLRLYNSDEKIRLVSYNILLSQLDRHQKPTNKWDQRKKRVKELLAHMDADIYILQECSKKQKNWVWEQFSKEYQIVTSSTHYFENLPVLFRKSRFELIKTSCWVDNGSERIRYVCLKDKKTQKELHLMNTHTEFQDMNKRQKTFDQIVNLYRDLDFPKKFLVGGDMNAFDPYIEIKNLPFWDGALLHQKLLRTGLNDVKELVFFGQFGPSSTFTNASAQDSTAFEGEGVPGIYLDRFYAAQGVLPLFFGVERGKVEGQYPSDHMPIFTEFVLIDE